MPFEGNDIEENAKSLSELSFFDDHLDRTYLKCGSSLEEATSASEDDTAHYIDC